MMAPTGRMMAMCPSTEGREWRRRILYFNLGVGPAANCLAACNESGIYQGMGRTRWGRMALL
jgi:hypothetical protein